MVRKRAGETVTITIPETGRGRRPQWRKIRQPNHLAKLLKNRKFWKDLEVVGGEEFASILKNMVAHTNNLTSALNQLQPSVSDPAAKARFWDAAGPPLGWLREQIKLLSGRPLAKAEKNALMEAYLILKSAHLHKRFTVQDAKRCRQPIDTLIKSLKHRFKKVNNRQGLAALQEVETFIEQTYEMPIEGKRTLLDFLPQVFMVQSDEKDRMRSYLEDKILNHLNELCIVSIVVLVLLTATLALEYSITLTTSMLGKTTSMLSKGGWICGFILCMTLGSLRFSAGLRKRLVLSESILFLKERREILLRRMETEGSDPTLEAELRIIDALLKDMESSDPSWCPFRLH